jgi:hypothetical protein
MKQNQTAPPRWALRFFKWFCNQHLAEAVLGDMLELYIRRRKSMPKWKADALFVANVIQFVQPFAIRGKSTPTLNTFDMYKKLLHHCLAHISQKQRVFIHQHCWPCRGLIGLFAHWLVCKT